MNKHERYVEICKQMELLGITDVSTQRQKNNDTRVWRLPIKYSTHNKFIEVASFKTGYVRNQNGGYTNYQLNKRCDGEPEYFQLNNGDYRKFTTRSCVLIPNEIDRLEYLIGYCLKNYYVKKANEVINGTYVSKWYHEYELERQGLHGNGVFHDRINDLEEKLDAMTEDRDHKVQVLENKLSNAISPTKYESVKRELAATKGTQAALEDLVIDLKAQLHLTQEEKDDRTNNLENKLATIERISSDRNKWDKE